MIKPIKIIVVVCILLLASSMKAPKLGVNTMRIDHGTDSIRTILEIVSSTDLIKMMPRATTKPYLERKLKLILFDHPKFMHSLGAIKRKDAHPNKAEDEFLAILKLQIEHLQRAAGSHVQ